MNGASSTKYIWILQTFGEWIFMYEKVIHVYGRSQFNHKQSVPYATTTWVCFSYYIHSIPANWVIPIQESRVSTQKPNPTMQSPLIHNIKYNWSILFPHRSRSQWAIVICSTYKPRSMSQPSNNCWYQLSNLKREHYKWYCDHFNIWMVQLLRIKVYLTEIWGAFINFVSFEHKLCGPWGVQKVKIKLKWTGLWCILYQIYLKATNSKSFHL